MGEALSIPGLSQFFWTGISVDPFLISNNYRLLVEMSSDLIWSVDVQGRWTFVNRRATRSIYGYEPEEMIGRSFVEFVDPEYLPRDLETFGKIKNGEVVFSYETRHITKLGGRVDLSFNATVVADEHGQILGTTGTAVNITEHRQVSKELERQKEFLRQVIDINPNLVFTKNRQGQFTLVNQATAEIYGTSVDSIVGCTDADFNSNEAEVEHFREDDLEVMNSLSEKFILEEQVTDSKGSIRWFQTVKRPIVGFDGKSDQILGIATDITQRRFIEQMLREIAEAVSRGHGHALFEALVLKVSQVIGVYHAFIAERTAGNPNLAKTRAVCIDGEILPNIEYELVGTPCEDVLSGHERFYPYNVCQIFPEDHLLRDMGVESYCGVPLFSSKGEVLGMLGVLDLKPLEQPEHVASMLKIFAMRIAAELERLAADRERADFEARLQHVQKLESLGVLAGGIAHDFNNLLVGILGNTSLALIDAVECPRILERLSQVKMAAEKASELTNHLLAYTGRASSHVSRINLSEVVMDMVSLLGASISKHAVIDYKCSSRAVYIDADKTQIQQIVMNLITNASDALEGEEGKIFISTGEVDIEANTPNFVFVQESLSGRCGYVEVADTGCGMDAGTIKKIFDPFFTTKFTGRGLGLATVLGIIRSHRGAVEVESKIGTGTTFRILFPLVHLEELASSEPVKISDKEEIINGAGRFVLVVDDEEIVRQVSKAMLEKIGFNVLLASRGDQAIGLFKEYRDEISCVVLDLTMPGMNGLEVRSEIRALMPNVPVIISSGYSVQEIGDVNDESGTFIQKPFSISKLKQALALVL